MEALAGNHPELIAGEAGASPGEDRPRNGVALRCSDQLGLVSEAGIAELDVGRAARRKTQHDLNTTLVIKEQDECQEGETAGDADALKLIGPSSAAELVNAVVDRAGNHAESVTRFLLGVPFWTGYVRWSQPSSLR